MTPLVDWSDDNENWGGNVHYASSGMWADAEQVQLDEDETRDR